MNQERTPDLLRWAPAPGALIMRTLLAAILGLLTIGCARQTSTSPSPAAAPWTPSCVAGVVHVTGQVVDFGSGLGLPGATVAFDHTAITGAGGAYTMRLPPGLYTPMVDGVAMGDARVRGCTYRGDFLVRSGLCVARYGTVTDVRTQRPVVDATVSLSGRSVRSGADGWYRIDLGCPENGAYGFNTTFIYASHPDYVDHSRVVGRGIYKVYRIDLELEPRQ